MLTRVLALCLVLSGPALACEAHAQSPAILAQTESGLILSDGFARASTPTAKAGAAFLVIENTGTAPDRLIAATSDAAQRVELHTHVADANGVMRMVHVEEGFEIAAGATRTLARGGDHVMLMGLTAPLLEGETVTITLTFETAGDVVVTMPVDLMRGNGGHGGHGG